MLQVIICVAGNLTARQLEAGHSTTNSQFPCPCGAQAIDYINISLVLEYPPLNSIRQRVMHFGTKEAGYAYTITNMEVCCLRLK